MMHGSMNIKFDSTHCIQLQNLIFFLIILLYYIVICVLYFVICVLYSDGGFSNLTEVPLP
jgi:hypothetical protein